MPLYRRHDIRCRCRHFIFAASIFIFSASPPLPPPAAADCRHFDTPFSPMPMMLRYFRFFTAFRRFSFFPPMLPLRADAVAFAAAAFRYDACDAFPRFRH